MTPTVGGAAAGVFASICLASPAEGEFFSVTAQVIPVLLLALAFEAKWIGTAPRSYRGDQLATALERVRRFGALGLIVVLVAGEWQSLEAVSDEGRNDSELAYAAVAWGIVTACLVALTGIARARITASLAWHPPASPRGPRDLVLEAGVGNEYGDKDIRLTMNLLFPTGTQVQRSDQDGNVAGPAALLRTSESVDPRFSGSVYVPEVRPATAGDYGVTYYRIYLPADEVKTALRFDHVELPRGRVEVSATIAAGSSGRVP